MKSAYSKIVSVAFTNAVIYLGLYLAFTNNTGFRELIAGSVVAIISTVAALVFASAGKVHFRFRVRDILQGWRMPWYAIDGTIEVLHGLVKQISKRRGASSFLAAVPFAPGKHNSLTDAGRRALEITYTTATPNFIIIGIIEEQKLLLYHQIIPGKVLAMTRNLGARS